MLLSTLEVLRCPFCGTRLAIVEGSPVVRHGDDIVDAVLGCQCCAFPVIDGIPVLIANDRVRDAMHQLEAGKRIDALHALLELDAPRVARFRAAIAGRAMTYREGLKILSVDAEAEYFVYRFSDPTFRVGRAVVQATGSGMRRTGRYIDLCGGSGHLTRSMVSDVAPVLADFYFWKLWLAKTFVAPFCEPVCCDANNPLPFARETFSLVVLSDAFPYLWHKRLAVDEMMRLAGPNGTIVMPHLHSSTAWNYTAGMPLTPSAYRDLLEPMQPRLYRETTLLDQVLDGYVDLTSDEPAEAIEDEPALVIVASRDPQVFRRFDMPFQLPAPDTLMVNPLYRVAVSDGKSVLTLSFPTAEYEDEFKASKRYLPESLILPGDMTKQIDAAALGAQYEDLVRRQVLISVPEKYL